MTSRLGARRPFRLAKPLAVAAVTALLVGGVALPAQAVEVTVITEAELTAALAGAETTRVTIGANITVDAMSLPVNSDAVVLDLNDRTLTTNTLDVLAGNSLTIAGGAHGLGTLNATGIGDYGMGSPAIATGDAALTIVSGTVNARVSSTSESAAIGGYGGEGSRGDGGSVTISGGNVSATAGNGAGIGSGFRSTDVGSIVINGGTVTALTWGYGSALGGSFRGSGGSLHITGGVVSATGMNNGAGIGGGTQTQGTDPFVVDITGGLVTAMGGEYSAGIGGGHYYSGSNVTIGQGATVTVGNAASGATQTDYAAFGASFAGDNGSLYIAGTVRVVGDAPFTRAADAATTIAPTGVVTGTNPLRGLGAITNSGAIRNPSVTGLAVTDKNYLVGFDANGGTATEPVRVYASTFEAGNRVVPTVTRPGYLFTNWNSAIDGSGADFTATTPVTGDSTQYAIWGPGSLVMSPKAATAVAGTSVAFTADALSGGVAADATSTTVFTSTDPRDVVSGNSVAFTTKGVRTITATNGALRDTATITVDPAALASLTVRPTDGSGVVAGQSRVFATEGFDAYGNSLGSQAATLASTVPGDTVTGSSIRFTTPGTRTVTAKVGAITVTVPVEVTVGPLARLQLTRAETGTLVAGGTTVITAEGFDAVGNSLGDVTAGTVFTSVPAAHSITGNTIEYRTAGDYTITATNGAGTAFTDVTVKAGPLARLAATPATTTVTAGDTVAFAVAGFDAYDNEVPASAYAAPVVSTDNPESDTVDGLDVTFSAAGPRVVTFASGAFSAAAEVTVEAGAIAELYTEVDSSAVAAGTDVAVTVTGYDSEGNNLGDVTAQTTVTISSGDPVVGNLVSVETAGEQTVTATLTADAAISASTTLTVRAASEAASIDFTLSDSVVTAGDYTLAEVIAIDRFGNRIGNVAQFASYSSSRGAVDEIGTSSIRFTKSGESVITASFEGFTDTATFTVVANRIHSIVPTISETEIAAGESATVTVEGFDALGNSVGDVTASATLTSLGHPEDVIDGTTITGTVAGLRSIGVAVGSSPVPVLLRAAPAEPIYSAIGLNIVADAANPASIELAVDRPYSIAGEAVRATVVAADRYGNSIGDVTADATITSSNSSDTVDGALVTVRAAGARTLTATFGGLSSSTDVTVLPYMVASIVVTGSADRIEAGGTVSFTAQGYDMFGNSTGDVTGGLQVASDVASDVVAGQTVTATTAGSRTITASFPLILAPVFSRAAAAPVATDTVSLLVVPSAAATIAVDLGGTVFAAGETATATVVAFDRFGNRIGDVTADSVLSTDNPADIIDGARITFAAAGAHRVTASYGGITAAAAVAVAVAAAPAPTSGAAAALLASTGVDIRVAGGLASALLALGMVLAVRRRRARA